MKFIKNEKAVVSHVGFEKLYSDLIILVIKQPTKNGFNYDDLKNTTKIEESVSGKSEGDNLIFEDAVHLYIKNIINKHSWGINDKAILDFVDAINNAQEYKIPT